MNPPAKIAHPAAILLLSSFLAGTLVAQPTNRTNRGFGLPGARIVSPEIASDRKVTFRIYAPKAESLRLEGGDIPGVGQRGLALTKDTVGVWSVTLGPIQPGAYRYHFNLEGVAIIDPRNPATSESNENAWSLFYVPGAEFMDTKNVPHGAIAQVTYYSSTLHRFRRMHIYTPPGYETGQGTYPIFYLLHGAFDTDAAWPTVGRAGFILDNLIAEKKAAPMVVVMPAGHTGPFSFGVRFNNEFERDFVNDVMPLVEQSYRVYHDRPHRAIAGLSMGGAQTLNIGFEHLDQFAYLGVYSSGIFGITGGGPGRVQAGLSWEERHKDTLDNPQLKEGLKLVWFATGKNDTLLKTSEATVQMLKKHGFDVTFKETPGAHTWIVWREYLNEFAPLLFR